MASNKKILIQKCSDSLRWYNNQIGQMVEYVSNLDDQLCYGSREKDGYANFVLKSDSIIVDIQDEMSK